MTYNEIIALITDCEKENDAAFRAVEQTALFNQEKVLNAFKNQNVALRHFAGSTGYGYEDTGKRVLSAVFADAFGAEAAVVSPLIASGTHAISTALFGLLRPGDTLFSASGLPYDTLVPVITGSEIGSLAEFGIKFEKADLTQYGDFDMPAVKTALAKKPAVVFIQRSRGYTWRDSFSVAQIGQIAALVRKISPDSVVVVDNCYGEFTEKTEPIAAGADVIIGSLIKNPGGGIAPTGGYIAGGKKYIDLIANRLTAPGVGTEVGSYAADYRAYFQGFFLAPHTVCQALKGALLFAGVFRRLGYDTLPKARINRDGKPFQQLSPSDENRVCNDNDILQPSSIGDIICSIRLNSKEELIRFCQAVQSASPVDGFAVPEPCKMPGYSDPVIMAAGTFVQGSSIELSADAPIRAPYTAFVQGGLTYEHIKIAVRSCVKALIGRSTGN
ncbi:MAG: methionine gamma-lyase family protein [Firmicutes bacterium]|nr:methionine gamma-lyase family protein [Bacillota bacterium]